MRSLIPLALLVVVAAGCGKSEHRSTPAPSTGSTTAQPTTTATTTTTPRVTTMVVRVYFLRDGKMAPAGREVPATQAVAFASIEELFAGPNGVDRVDGLTSAVPANASPGAVTLANGIATVDLPQLSHAGLAQVVYTLTQFPTVRGVRTARSIGDTRPLTRADFEDVTPAILVESPLPHERVASPLHVSGTANTFEATFVARLLDSAGRELARKVVTATSGSGMRGTYDAALTFPDTATPRWLEAYEPSAENGRPLHKVRIPVNG